MGSGDGVAGNPVGGAKKLGVNGDMAGCAGEAKRFDGHGLSGSGVVIAGDNGDGATEPKRGRFQF